MERRGIDLFFWLSVLVLLMFILASCTPGFAPFEYETYFHNEPTPDRISDHGVHIHAQGFDEYLTHNAIEDQHEWLMGMLVEKAGYDRSKMLWCLARAQLWVWPREEITSWQWGGRPAVGYQDGNVLHIAGEKCPWDSALTHETLHWFQTCVKGFSDYHHKDFTWGRDYLGSQPEPRGK